MEEKNRIKFRGDHYKIPNLIMNPKQLHSFTQLLSSNLIRNPRQFLVFSLIFSGKANTREAILRAIGACDNNRKTNNENARRYIIPLEDIGLIERDELDKSKTRGRGRPPNTWSLSILERCPKCHLTKEDGWSPYDDKCPKCGKRRLLMDTTCSMICAAIGIDPKRHDIPETLKALYENAVIRRIFDPTRKGRIKGTDIKGIDYNHSLIDFFAVCGKREKERFEKEYMARFFNMPWVAIYFFLRKEGGEIEAVVSRNIRPGSIFTAEDEAHTKKELIRMIVPHEIKKLETPGIDPYEEAERKTKNLFDCFNEKSPKISQFNIREKKFLDFWGPVYDKHKDNPSMPELVETGKKLFRYWVIDDFYLNEDILQHPILK